MDICSRQKKEKNSKPKMERVSGKTNHKRRLASLAPRVIIVQDIQVERRVKPPISSGFFT